MPVVIGKTQTTINPANGLASFRFDREDFERC
jgi:hypothetical protein